MKKELLYSLAGLCAGVVIGFTTAVIIQKVKENKEKKKEVDDSPLLMSDIPEKEEHEEEEEVIVLTQEEAKDKYHDILVKHGYVEEAAEREFPSDDDPDDIALKNSIRLNREREEYRKKHEGQIEMMGFDEDGEAAYDTDFPEEDYDHAELLYFPSEEILCDEAGQMLFPIEKYVGNLIELADSGPVQYDYIYVRNHVLETDFKVFKETRFLFGEYFDPDN